jgi:hypothetical protein
MARTIKIDNALQKRFQKPARKRPERYIKVYFLIVCEGKKTEPNYFRSFPKQVDKYVIDPEIDGGGINTVAVVDKAIELRDRYEHEFDRVWAVFDKDSFSDKNFNAAILKAKKNEIDCAWSNEAFELWYLLHFCYRDTGMKRDEYADKIEKFVNKANGKNKFFKYKKNATDTYEILQKYGSQEDAIKNAEKLSKLYKDERFAKHNPRTEVYKLVKQLIGRDEKLNEEIKEKLI